MSSNITLSPNSRYEALILGRWRELRARVSHREGGRRLWIIGDFAQDGLIAGYSDEVLVRKLNTGSARVVQRSAEAA